MFKWLKSKKEKNLRNGILVLDETIRKLLHDNHELQRRNDRLYGTNQKLIEANDSLIRTNESLIETNDGLLKLIGKIRKRVSLTGAEMVSFKSIQMIRKTVEKNRKRDSNDDTDNSRG